MLKEGLERNLEFSMKLMMKLDLKKGGQVATVAEFNREKEKKKKEFIYLSRSASTPCGKRCRT